MHDLTLERLVIHLFHPDAGDHLVIRLKEIDLLADGACGVRVIASNHQGAYAGASSVLNGGPYLNARWIDHPK